MLLDPNEKEAVRSTLAAVKAINEGLGKLRSMKIACNLIEHDGHYFLNAKAIITERDTLPT